MVNTETAACSLAGEDLGRRIRQWADVTSEATSRNVRGGRIVSTYPRDQGLLEQLRELIAAEAECCSFMDFDIQESADEVVVELRVPDEMTETLAVMLGLVTEQSSSG